MFTKGATGGATEGVAALRSLADHNEVTFDVTDDACAFTESNLAKYRVVVFLNNAGELLDDGQQAAFENVLPRRRRLPRHPLGDRGRAGLDVPDRRPRHARRGPHRSARRRPPRSPTACTSPARACPSTGRARTAGTTSPATSAASRTSSRRSTRTPTPAARTASTIRSPGARTTRAAARSTPAPAAPPSSFGDGHRPPSARGRARLGRRHGERDVQRLRRHRAGRTTSRRRSRLRRTSTSRSASTSCPTAGSCRPSATGASASTTRLTGTSTVIATLPVYQNSEDGLYGPAFDRNFEQNQWVYFYYAPINMEGTALSGKPYPAQTPNGNIPTTPQADPAFWDDWKGYFQLSRFKFVDGPNPTIDFSTEQKIMKVEVDRGACCHVAGDMDFDKDNNLWLMTGDDTPATAVGTNNNPPMHDMLTNESQTITVANATGGTFTLTFDGQTTAPIAFPLVNTEIEAALEALSNIDDVAVTGTGARTVNFRANQQQKDVPQMTADGDRAHGHRADGHDRHVGGGRLLPGAVQRRAPRRDQHRRPARQAAADQGQGRRHRRRRGEHASAARTTCRPATCSRSGPRRRGPRSTRWASGTRSGSRWTRTAWRTSPTTRRTRRARPACAPPRARARIEIVRKPSNYGWPMCYKTDLPMYKWDFNTQTTLGETFECDNPDHGPTNDVALEHRPAAEPRRSRTRTSGTRTATTCGARRASTTTTSRSRSSRAARCSSRSCGRRTQQRRPAPDCSSTTTRRTTRARRSSRRTSTTPCSSASGRATTCVRSASTRTTGS